MEKRQIVGLGACLLLFFGVFAPIISLPLMGGMNYFQNGRGDGTIVLLISAVSVVLILFRKYALLWISSAAVLGMLTFTFVSFQARMTELRAELQRTLEGNPFAGIGALAVQSVQIQWGWAVLVLGALLLLGCAAWASDLPERGAVPKRLGFVFAVVFAVAVATYALTNISSSTHAASTGVQKPAEPVAASTATPQNKLLEWELRETTNEMDGSKLTALYHASETEVPGLIGTVRPSIIIRCREKTTDVIVNVESQIESPYGDYDAARVRIKFDDGAPVRQRWLKATSGDALFAPDPITLARRMAGSKTLLFEYTPFQRAEQTVKFNLDGLTEQLPKVAEACHWSL